MSGATSPFGDTLQPGASARPLSPPVPLLVFASLALLGSLALLFTGGFADVAHVIGWLLASIVGVGLLAAFTAQDLKRREQRNYSPQPMASTVRSGLALTALVLCGLHAWTLAWSLASR
jgi:hypothetical protein